MAWRCDRDWIFLIFRRRKCRSTTERLRVRTRLWRSHSQHRCDENCYRRRDWTADFRHFDCAPALERQAEQLLHLRDTMSSEPLLRRPVAEKKPSSTLAGALDHIPVIRNPQRHHATDPDRINDSHGEKISFPDDWTSRDHVLCLLLGRPSSALVGPASGQGLSTLAPIPRSQIERSLGEMVIPLQPGVFAFGFLD